MSQNYQNQPVYHGGLDPSSYDHQSYDQTFDPSSYDPSYDYSYPATAFQPSPDMSSFNTQVDGFMPPFWPMPQFPFYTPIASAPDMNNIISAGAPTPAATGAPNGPAIPGLTLLSSKPSTGHGPNENSFTRRTDSKAKKKETGSVLTGRDHNVGSKKALAKAPSGKAASTRPALAKAIPTKPVGTKNPVIRIRIPSKAELVPFRDAAAAFVSVLIANGISLADVQQEKFWSNGDKRKLSKLFNEVRLQRPEVATYDSRPAGPGPTGSAAQATSATTATASSGPASAPASAAAAAPSKPIDAAPTRSKVASFSGSALASGSATAARTPGLSREEYLAKLRASRMKIQSKGDNKSVPASASTADPPPPPKPESDTGEPTLPATPGSSMANHGGSTNMLPPRPNFAVSAGPSLSAEERRRMQTDLARKRLLALAQQKAAAKAAQESSSASVSTCTDSSSEQADPVMLPAGENSQPVSVSGLKRPLSPAFEAEPKSKRAAPDWMSLVHSSGASSVNVDETIIIEVSDSSDDSDSEGENEASYEHSIPARPTISAVISANGVPRSSSLPVVPGSARSSQSRLEPQLREMELRIAQLKRHIERKEAQAKAAKAASASSSETDDLSKPASDCAIPLSDDLRSSASSPAVVSTQPEVRLSSPLQQTRSSSFPHSAVSAPPFVPAMTTSCAPGEVVFNPADESASSASMSDSSDLSSVSSSDSSDSSESDSGSDSGSGSGSDTGSESDDGSATVPDPNHYDEQAGPDGNDSNEPDSDDTTSHGPSEAGEVESDASGHAGIDGNPQGECRSSDSDVELTSKVAPTVITAPSSDFSRTVLGATPGSDRPENAQAAYDSPLRLFRTFRFHPEFLNSVRGGFRSLTFSHKFDPNVQLCSFDVTGKCADPTCRRGQHWRDGVLTDEALFAELGAPSTHWSTDMKDRWGVALKEAIQSIASQKVTDANVALSYIINFRRRFLNDDSRVATA